METTDAFVGLECPGCGERHDAATVTHRCPDCGRRLDPAYDLDLVDLDALQDSADGSMWQFESLLPFPQSASPTVREGGTPLVECPAITAELGVDAVFVKDEGRNPTGSATDRGMAIAIAAAAAHDAPDVALPATGNGGQSAAAYAARAGLDAHVFLPSRAPFSNKAMVNVHGGEMSVVGGRYDDAREAFEDATTGNSWHSLAPFETPYRHEGAKTIAHEIAADLDWSVPDAVVCPVGHGTMITGIHRGFTELVALGLVGDVPQLYAAQATGCAPIVEAIDAGNQEHEPWEGPDTICGGIEVPDPEGGAPAIEAVRDSDGGAVATDDDDILESGCWIAANEGLAVTPSSAAAASGAWELAEREAFDAADTVVLVTPAAANKEADVLRSHLMSKGV